jgi:RNA polymerase sigma factor (TIGR02999 family)
MLYNLSNPKVTMSGHTLTQVLQAVEQGQAQASEELIPLVYNELRVLAARKLAHEQPGQTLQATALVHEAYLRLVGSAGQPSPQWQGRRHFFGAAAEAMRRILIENARRKQSQRRGGGRQRVDWSEVNLAVETDSDQLLAVHEALGELEKHDPQAADLVKLRFFVGMGGEEAAKAMELPVRTATRVWAYARAWLLKTLQSNAG